MPKKKPKPADIEPEPTTELVPAEPPEQTADKVGVIIKIMAAGEWNNVRKRELAEAWRLSHSYIGNLAGQASRALDSLGDRKQILNQASALLYTIANERAPDRVPAIKELLRVRGVDRMLQQEAESTATDGERREMMIHMLARPNKELVELLREAMRIATDDVRKLYVKIGKGN